MVINTFRHCTLYCEKLRITRIVRMTMTHPCTYVPISTVHSRKDERMRENKRERVRGYGYELVAIILAGRE